MAKTKEEILEILEENRSAILAHGVRRLGLFGSIIRGKNTLSSDLDFVVEFDKKSFDAYMDLKAFLEELFGCQVDLVIAEAVKPRLRAAILDEALYAPGL